MSYTDENVLVWRHYRKFSIGIRSTDIYYEIKLPSTGGPSSVRPILGRHNSDINLDDEDDIFSPPRKHDDISAGLISAANSFRTELNSMEDDEVFSDYNSPDYNSPKGFNSPSGFPSLIDSGFPETPYGSHSDTWFSSANNPFLTHTANFPASVPSAISSGCATPNSTSTSATRSTRSSGLVTPDMGSSPMGQYRQSSHPQYASPSRALPVTSSQLPPNWQFDTSNQSQNSASSTEALEMGPIRTSVELPVPHVVTQLANFPGSLCQSLANLNIQGRRNSGTSLLPIEPVAASANVAQYPMNGFYQINGLQNIGYTDNSYPVCPTPTSSPQSGQPIISSDLLDGLVNNMNDMDSQVNMYQVALLLQLLAQQSSQASITGSNGPAGPVYPSNCQTSSVYPSNGQASSVYPSNGQMSSVYPSNGQMSSVYPYNNRSLEEGRFCAFCKRNRETKEFYTTHVVKDSRGKVICPVLRKYTCPVCKASGDKAHTLRHCPVRLHAAKNPQP